MKPKTILHIRKYSLTNFLKASSKEVKSIFLTPFSKLKTGYNGKKWNFDLLLNKTTLRWHQPNHGEKRLQGNSYWRIYECFHYQPLEVYHRGQLISRCCAIANLISTIIASRSILVMISNWRGFFIVSLRNVDGLRKKTSKVMLRLQYFRSLLNKRNAMFWNQ